MAIIMIAGLTLLFTNTSVWGQQSLEPMQMGYVKTKGRMVEGKHVRGNGIKGAVVQLQGRTAVGVQKDNGQFSFPVVGEKYTVQSVIKNGYQLVDADAAPKTYSYSNNPLYLVMETPGQQIQDLLESERKIRRTLQRQLQRREDELEELKESHQITVEEYQRAMQKLYADEKNNESLISKMAKEYAQMDYDQLNELKQRIYDAISNGRLAEADSLMLTKGEMRSRMERVKQKQQVENEREKEIEEETKELNEAKGGTQKEIDEIEEDCRILRDRFMLELEIDSASYYVDLLASFDSTNVRYLARAGKFYDDICSYEKAESFYLKALNICRQSFEEYAFEICALQQNLAAIYQTCKNYSKAEELIKDNIVIVNRFGGKIHSKTDEEDVFDECTSLLGLGGLYVSTKQYADAESLYLDLLEKLYIGHFGYEDEYNQSMIASVLWMLGTNYYYDKKYEKSDSVIKESVFIYQGLALNDMSYYDILGGTLASWAAFKSYQEQYDKSKSLYKMALEAFNKSKEDNKELNIAQIWWHLGYLCQNTNRPTESEDWYKDALSVYRRYALALPEKYNDELSIQIKGLAGLYKDLGRLEESESLFEEVLKIDSVLSLKDPQKFTPPIAYVKNELGEIKVLQKQYYEADSLFNDALRIRKQFAEGDHETYDSQVVETLGNLVDLYSGMAKSYYDNHNYSECEVWQLKALEVQQQLVETNPNDYELDLAVILEKLAIIYWDTRRFQEAETLYDNCLEIVRKFAETNANLQQNYANLLYRLSQLYPAINNYKAAYKLNKEWLPILKQQFEEYPYLMRKDYAEGLGRQSFYAIFQSQYNEAEQLARDGLKLDSTLHWIASNLAPALLFQGKYKDAEKIYQQYKDELKDAFLDDFKQFSEAGVIPKKREKDVEIIKQLLNK
jgi:tetratricopeptide (TPR) repeat protein